MSAEADELRETLAKNIAAARAAHALTQVELAHRAKVSRATVIQIEGGGEGDIKLSTLANLAAALQSSSMMLLMGPRDLAAISKMLRSPEEVEAVRAHDPEGSEKPVAHLRRAEKLAGKRGKAVAEAAGLGVASYVGGAIGTLALPGIGTAVGAVIGAYLGRSKGEDDG